MNEAKVSQRDEWEIKEDMSAVKRALSIFKDPARFQDVKNMIKSERSDEKSLDMLVDGKLYEALGISEESEKE